MYFTRSSKSYTKEQYKQANYDLLLYKENIKEELRYAPGKHPGAYILDSSLIFATKYKKYDLKIIQCGDYFQVYKFNGIHLSKDKNITGFDKIVRHIRCEKDDRVLSKKQLMINDEYRNFYSSPLFSIKLSSINNLGEFKKKYNFVDSIIDDNEKEEFKKIELKNIIRSKTQMQRLVKSNENEFKTFTTLTFADNIVNIEEANKKLHIWLTYISRLLKSKNKELKYVGVPEFQKGREVKYGYAVVHYHLLTNIDYNDFDLLSKEERKIWHKKSKSWQIGRDIKGWSYGHNMTKKMDGINVVAYMTKYMTKDIDNRLWGKRRYFNSHNLRKPSIVYLDTNRIDELGHYYNILNYDLKYNSEYKNIYNENIIFEEYKVNKNAVPTYVFE